MCNRSGGLITRVLEALGIPTVSLSINRAFSEKIKTARTAFVKYPYGAPFGEPNVPEQHMTLLRDLLVLLQTAQTPGQIVDLPYKWRKTHFEPVAPASFAP